MDRVDLSLIMILEVEQGITDDVASSCLPLLSFAHRHDQCTSLPVCHFEQTVLNVIRKLHIVMLSTQPSLQTICAIPVQHI